MSEQLHFNQTIVTPNGRGVLEGNFWDQGFKGLMVSHKIAEMTSTDKGKCLTRGVYVGRWIYPPQEVKPA